MTPIFLELGEVVLIHRDQIERYGGAQGVRDMGLLKSALAMPSTGVGDDYFHADLFAMAAAYLFHIVRNHPFVDGNKCTALATCLVFLCENGLLPEEELDADAWEQLTLAVAAGRLDRERTGARLRKLLSKRK